MAKSKIVKEIRCIDLFAGLGGIRLGLSIACEKMDIPCSTVFTSEIKAAALKALEKNFERHKISGDITKVNIKEIPDFDILLAGFPCQPFSYAGSGKGFADTRGTLFFNIEEILRQKSPYGFILENVEGLVKHDLVKGEKIGRTLNTILEKLNNLGYKTNWAVLNSVDFGVPQQRKRIYIVGTKDKMIDLSDFPKKYNVPEKFLESGLPIEQEGLALKLTKKFKPEALIGKKIKDKRGGKENIHSWDLEIKGPVSKEQSELLSSLLKVRRQKKWAAQIGIEWMDGMPLTYKQIKTFIQSKTLKEDLDYLTKIGYLRLEHPKAKVSVIDNGKVLYYKRIYDKTKEKGYNIVSGKLSFAINEIVHPKKPVRTLVASDLSRIYVYDILSKGLRKLTRNECLRLSGYPENYKWDFEVSDKDFYDLIGNTVCVPVIESIAERILQCRFGKK